MLVLEGLYYRSQRREGLVDVLGFADALGIALTVELLASCQVDEGELGDHARLLLKLLLKREVLLAVLAATEIAEQIPIKLGHHAGVVGIQLDHEDGVAPGALDVLRGLVHLPALQSVIQYTLSFFQSAEEPLLYVLDDYTLSIV